MKDIQIFEQAIKSAAPIKFSEQGINQNMYLAYKKSKEVGNDLIDFHEVIWDTDIAEIAATCDKEGIEEFTISCQYSGLLDTLALFETHGFVIDGLAKVKATYRDWKTEEYATIPAIKMVRHA